MVHGTVTSFPEFTFRPQRVKKARYMVVGRLHCLSIERGAGTPDGFVLFCLPISHLPHSSVE